MTDPKFWTDIDKVWDEAPCRLRIVADIGDVERIAWSEPLTESDRDIVDGWAREKWGPDLEMVWESHD